MAAVNTLTRVSVRGTVRVINEATDSPSMSSVVGSQAARSLWADAVATAIQLGGGAANTSTLLRAAVAGTVSVGDGAFNQIVNVGSAITTSSTLVRSGTGGLSLTTAGATAMSFSTNSTVRSRVTGDGAQNWVGIATASAPAVSSAGESRLYYDTTLDQVMLSRNTSAYAALAVGVQTLAQTLAAGNTTGAFDITVSAGQSIFGENDNGLFLEAGFASGNGQLAQLHGSDGGGVNSNGGEAKVRGGAPTGTGLAGVASLQGSDAPDAGGTAGPCYALGGNAVTGNSFGGELFFVAGDGSGTSDGAPATFGSGDALGVGNGGQVSITTGIPVDGNGGTSGALAFVTTATAGFTNNEGSGSVSFGSGTAAGVSGDISYVTGDSENLTSGQVFLRTGHALAATVGISGEIALITGDGGGDVAVGPLGASGPILISTGDSTAADTVQRAQSGSIEIVTGTVASDDHTGNILIHTLGVVGNTDIGASGSIALVTDNANNVGIVTIQCGYSTNSTNTGIPGQILLDPGGGTGTPQTVTPGYLLLGQNAGQFLGFFTTTLASTAVQQTVTGSRGGNAALASLLSALAAYNLIVDSSSA